MNLCCAIHPDVTCTLCGKKWCKDHWEQDKTHANGSIITRCPVTGRKISWDFGGRWDEMPDKLIA